MKFSKRVNYLLIGFLAMLNIVFRYPFTPHAQLTDSYTIQNLASSLSSCHYARWIIHPASLFGWYPLSYPSAEPFILSSVSQVTGMGMEWTILPISIFFGVIGGLTIYLVAKDISKNDLIAFATALLYSTSPVFLACTNWTATTRGLFIAMLPLFVWVLIRCNSSIHTRIKFIVLSIFLLLFLGTVHRMVVFCAVPLLAYIITIKINTSGKVIKISKLKDRRLHISIFSFIFCILFLMGPSGLSPYHPTLEDFKHGYFFKGSSLPTILLNMGIDYAMGIGVLIILAPLGLIWILWKRKKTFPETYLLLTILCLAPFLTDLRYMGAFILPFILLLIGYGTWVLFLAIKKYAKLKRFLVPVMISILIISASLPQFVTVKHTGEISEKHGYCRWMDERTFNAALFFKEYGGNSSAISNDRVIGMRILATSDSPVVSGGPMILNYVFVRRGDLRVKATPIPEYISLQMKGGPDYLWTLEDWLSSGNYFGGKHRWIIMESYDSGRTNNPLSFYNIQYVIVNNHFPNKWGSSFYYNDLRESIFLPSVYEKKYKIYDTDLESIWYLGVPMFEG